MKILIRWLCALSLLHLVLVSLPASAFVSRGIINARYSFERLELERDDKGDCYLSGLILNRTHKPKENVRITFYAMSLHGEVLWRLRVKVNFVNKFDSIAFEERIKQCHRTTPYKWKFKVVDRNL